MLHALIRRERYKLSVTGSCRGGRWWNPLWNCHWARRWSVLLTCQKKLTCR